MTNSVEEKVRAIICEICDTLKANEIALDENLQDMGVNSVSFIKIILAMEREFGFTSNDEDLVFEGLQTLRGIVGYIEKKIEF